MTKIKEHVCSVTIDVDKCKGCVHCMRRCPTEAIRVRDGRAQIIEPRCVGCGVCVRSCPTRAKIAVTDPFSAIERYRYRIALPAPTCFGQFPNLESADVLLQGLLDIGFDAVEEVAVAAEIAAERTREYLAREDIARPVISSACPAIVKLIQISYGNLVEQISPVLMPEEIAAARAVKAAMRLGYPREEIGVFVISPCSAKWEALKGNPDVDGVIGFQDVYFRLVTAMNKNRCPLELSSAGRLGMAWATSGGEADGVRTGQYLAADGVENCIEILEEIERDKLYFLDFVELNACPGGCVGGVCNIENPFLATSRIRTVNRTRPATEPHADDANPYINESRYERDNVFRLSDNRAEAMRIMQTIECIHSALPGVDCGSCGAPSCRAMAEDVVMYNKDMEACPFVRKRREEEQG